MTTKREIELRLLEYQAGRTGKAPFGPVADLRRLYASLGQQERAVFRTVLEEKKTDAFWREFIDIFERESNTDPPPTAKEYRMFTRLEREVLAWFQGRHPGTGLHGQIGTAKLVKRTWTRVGFYTEIEVGRDAGRHTGAFPVYGPNIRSAGIDGGGGCLLWGEDGFVNCLELYANGEYFNEEIDDFELLDR